MKILLTNDDSWDAPLFRVAMAFCQSLGQVKAVVPAEEQSWKGRAMTRFEPLHLEKREGFPCETHTLSGTPADCANFGIYHMFDEKPDLVVSGINMGSNSGLGYASASGTVGAALEANLAGIPSVALSQGFPPDVFKYWIDHRVLPPDKQDMMIANCKAMLKRVFEFLEAEDYMSQPVTWNVNFPRNRSADWQVLPAALGFSLYTSCFKLHGDVYRHDMDSPVIEERAGTDGMVLRDGHVSVTQLDIRAFGQP